MQPSDFEGLERLKNADPVICGFLEYYTNKDYVKETNVDELGDILKTLGFDCDRNKRLNIMKDLAKVGLGEYRVGRRGFPTRIEWNPRMNNYLRIGLVKNIKEEEKHNGKVMVSHSYRLRPKEQPVTFELPEDLTSVEASRLARFIETLPLAP